jgi:hypothetical protein
MTRKNFVTLLLCLFLSGCVTVSPKTDIQMNVAVEDVNIDSICIEINAQQLPAAFADSLRTNLKKMFQTEGMPILIKNIASGDELPSSADVNAIQCSHIMLITTRQIVVDTQSKILNSTLNITLIDVQKDTIVMRANAKVEPAINEDLESIFTSKPNSVMGEEEGKAVVDDLISKMKTSGLLETITVKS